MGEELRMIWDSLTPAAMSDQEYDEEQQLHVNRTIPWRSGVATNLIKQIDHSLKVVRVYGEPSLRKPDNKCGPFVEEGYIDDN